MLVTVYLIVCSVQRPRISESHISTRRSFNIDWIWGEREREEGEGGREGRERKREHWLFVSNSVKL